MTDEQTIRTGIHALPSPDPTLAAIERTEAILQRALTDLRRERRQALDRGDREAYRVVNYAQAGVEGTLARLRGEYGA